MRAIRKESAINMSQTEKLLFSIADHVTPKIDEGGVAYTLESRDYKSAQVIMLENHPADSRLKLSEDNIVQTLNSRMGTGGGQYSDGIRHRQLHSPKTYTA